MLKQSTLRGGFTVLNFRAVPYVTKPTKKANLTRLLFMRGHQPEES